MMSMFLLFVDICWEESQNQYDIILNVKNHPYTNPHSTICWVCHGNISKINGYSIWTQ